MSIDPGMLLKLLGSGVRPVDGASDARPSADLTQASFGALLDRARAGELGGGRPVAMAPEIGQRLTLTPEQSARLSSAVDRAELSGVRRALVLMDGMELVVEVADRVVVAEGGLASGEPLAAIDGVIRADNPDGDPPPPGGAELTGLGGLTRHKGLLDALTRGDETNT